MREYEIERLHQYIIDSHIQHFEMKSGAGGFSIEMEGKIFYSLKELEIFIKEENK